MNTDSSPNYSSIYLCYSIRVYWMYAAWLQMFWRDGKMTRNSGRSHLSCFRTLHLSSTSASTANANSLYVLLGRNTEKISHNRGFFFSISAHVWQHRLLCRLEMQQFWHVRNTSGLESWQEQGPERHFKVWMSVRFPGVSVVSPEK